MIQIALAMLFGDRGRYLGIVLGISFSAFVITQQGSIFCGLMSRTFGFLSDTSQPDVWVVDPQVKYVDDIKPLQDTQLLRVKGIPGVAWAVPMYKGQLKARLQNGGFQTCNVIGLDDTTLVGGPPVMIEGSLADLRRADGVIVDDVGARTKLARKRPDGSIEPLKVGDTLELNEHRAIVVGIARVTRTFQSQPVLYTTYSRATSFAPRERRLLSFVLAKAKDGVTPEELAASIKAGTSLGAFTLSEFKVATVNYFLKNTGIPINFGISVLLGLIVGTAIAGQTFYNFTIENIRYFGALKAMGATSAMLLRMIIVQALVVGIVGYGLGVGAAGSFYYLAKNSELAFFLPWQLLAIVGGSVTFICVLSAVISMIKVIRLDPAVVFRS